MNKILEFLNLHTGEDDRNNVLEDIRSNISFRGANLWILSCAIVIASIGLNVNSPAVIIGAMLISPLMGPIIGAGFALGIFDSSLLKRSLKNLLVATLASLAVSTLYFYLSPFKETQSEILARTSPNIYDILIAFFGGLVGVIAITRKQKGNPIPGVAIATALMPPLCTAGYGLAVGNLRFFAGALYLYAINCVFICVATFLIVKYLKYPRIVVYAEKKEKRVTIAVTLLTLILFVPGIYFAYQLFEQKKVEQKIGMFLSNEFDQKGYTIIYRNTEQNLGKGKLELALLNKKFNATETSALQQKLPLYGLPQMQLLIRQDTTNLKKDILNQIKKERAVVDQKEILISELKKQIMDSQYDNRSLLEEVKVVFPAITDISISNHPFHIAAGQDKIIPVAIYTGKAALSESDTEKLQSWIKVRIDKPDVFVFWKKST